MSAAAVKHRTVVNYAGSLASMHGLMYVVAYVVAGRATLRTAWGEKLENVRPESYAAVDGIPAFTEHRMYALRELDDRRDRAQVDTRAANWLIEHKMAERCATEFDETVRLRITNLGHVVSASHRNR